MKTKIIFFAIVVTIIGLNTSIFFTNETNDFSLSKLISINKATAEDGSENCHENWKECTRTSPNTGRQYCGCEDPCDNDSGNDCSSATSCDFSSTEC
jgi:hypothetical protein